MKDRENEEKERLWLLTSCETRFMISLPHYEKSPGHNLTKWQGKSEYVRLLGRKYISTVGKEENGTVQKGKEIIG